MRTKVVQCRPGSCKADPAPEVGHHPHNGRAKRTSRQATTRRSTASTTFAPNANCTSAQMVAFLWRAAGQPAAGDVRMTFKDVDRNAYYYQALLWAISEGITTGVSETSFAPNATCTRAQMVTFLYRMAGKPTVTAKHAFEDVSAEDYYNTAVAWAVQEGITTGMTETTFAPAAFCTRGQTVTFLYRMLAEKEQ